MSWLLGDKVELLVTQTPHRRVKGTSFACTPSPNKGVCRDPGKGAEEMIPKAAILFGFINNRRAAEHPRILSSHLPQ